MSIISGLLQIIYILYKIFLKFCDRQNILFLFEIEVADAFEFSTNPENNDRLEVSFLAVWFC